MEDSKSEPINMSEIDAEELVNGILDVYVSLYLYQVAYSEDKDKNPEETKQLVEELRVAFDVMQKELVRRASRGTRKKKIVNEPKISGK